MINYGSNDIIVGYIKQLLHSFNLPMIDVYKKGDRLAKFHRYIKDNAIYGTHINIRDGVVLDKKPFSPYSFNNKIINLTSNFNNKSLVYDLDTHKYLGKYLRFLRDYKKLDLMSLYNYFSNEYVSNLDFTKKDNSVQVSLEKSDSRYKYYLIPIVAGTEYTFAIECPAAYEVCCMFYSKDYYPSSDLFLENATYDKLAPSSFNKPFIYDKLSKDNFIEDMYEKYFSEYYRLKDMLCLVLKIPVSCNSSIVILEGNHTADNDFRVKDNSEFVYNYSITNYENTTEDQFIDIPLKTNSQLLGINSGISHPFADKLIGYLLGNTISSMTEISEDIKRIQKKLYELKYYSDNDIVKINNIDIPYGIWKNKYRNVLYDYHRKVSIDNFTQSQDVLGYCDKDVEKSLALFKSNGKDIKI